MIKPICGSSNLILNRLQKRGSFLLIFALSIVNIALAENVQRSKPAVQKHAEYFDEWQSPSFDCDPIWDGSYKSILHDDTETKRTVCNSALLSYLDRMQGLGLQRMKSYIDASNTRGTVDRFPVFVGVDVAIDSDKYRQINQEWLLLLGLLDQSHWVCDADDELCLLRVYLNNTRYCGFKHDWDPGYGYVESLERSRFVIDMRGYLELSQFCGRARYWQSFNWGDQYDSQRMEENFLRLLSPYELPKTQPLPLTFVVSHTKPDRSQWYNKYNRSNDPWIGFKGVTPIPEYWSDDAGVLGILNYHPRRDELICGLPVVLASTYPKSTSLPNIQPIAKASRREDEIFTTLNLHKQWSREDFINPDSLSGQFRVVDRFFAEEVGDPTPFWATAVSRNPQSCFPLPADKQDLQTYFIKNRTPFSVDNNDRSYPDRWKWDNTWEYIQGDFHSRLEYERVVNNLDANYYRRQVMHLNLGKTYSPNPYQTYFGDSYIGDGNIFYSTGEDSPEGWYVYEGSRLSRTWRSNYVDGYRWDKRVKPEYEEGFNPLYSDISFARLWMGTRTHLNNAWGDSYEDKKIPEQAQFMVAGGLMGYKFNAVPECPFELSDDGFCSLYGPLKN